MKSATVSIVAGAIAISFSALLVKLSGAPPAAAGCYRMLIACIFLSGNARFAFGLSKKILLLSVLCGLFFSLDLLSWHRSIALIGTGLATVINNAQVLFVVLFLRLARREIVTARRIVHILIAFSGAAMITAAPAGASVVYRSGVLLGLLSAMSYAGFIICLKELRSADRNVTARQAMWLSSMSALPILLACSLFLNEPLLFGSAREFAALLAYGLVCQVLGWSLIAFGVDKLPASIAAVLLMIQPALSYLWDVLFLGKKPALIELLGGAALIYGMIACAGREPGTGFRRGKMVVFGQAAR